ncbi:MAG: hypothetical protein ABH846_02500 [Patescibacteria group bacterium]
MVARDKGIDPAYADLMKGSEAARNKGLAEQRAELNARIKAMKEAEAAGRIEAAGAQAAIKELRQQEAALEAQTSEDLEAFKGMAAQEAQGDQTGMYATETLDMSDFDMGDINLGDEKEAETSTEAEVEFGGLEYLGEISRKDADQLAAEADQRAVEEINKRIAEEKVAEEQRQAELAKKKEARQAEKRELTAEEQERVVELQKKAEELMTEIGPMHKRWAEVVNRLNEALRKTLPSTVEIAYLDPRDVPDLIDNANNDQERSMFQKVSDVRGRRELSNLLDQYEEAIDEIGELDPDKQNEILGRKAA